jgi:hypothetical protein
MEHIKFSFIYIKKAVFIVICLSFNFRAVLSNLYVAIEKLLEELIFM